MSSGPLILLKVALILRFSLFFLIVFHNRAEEAAEAASKSSSDGGGDAAAAEAQMVDDMGKLNTARIRKVRGHKPSPDVF